MQLEVILVYCVVFFTVKNNQPLETKKHWYLNQCFNIIFKNPLFYFLLIFLRKQNPIKPNAKMANVVGSGTKVLAGGS